MCVGGKVQTVRKVRSQLRHPTTPRKWSVTRRKAYFGWTEAQVRRQLVTTSFCGKRITVHSKVVPSLRRVETHIRNSEAKNGYPKWVPVDVQCFNWRQIRGGTSLSRHAHAIALDIHPAKNPYYNHYTGLPNQTTDLPAHVLNGFLAEKWTCGIEWDAPLDVMHVQFC